MPRYTPEQIYAAARALLPALDADTRRQVEDLLGQAERGRPADRALLDLLTRDEATRRQMRALLKGEVTEQVMRGFAGLTGELTSTKPGEVFVCPAEGCGYRYIIGEVNERPVPCPRHPHMKLVREREV